MKEKKGCSTRWTAGAEWDEIGGKDILEGLVADVEGIKLKAKMQDIRSA